MKFIRYETKASKEELLSMLSDNDSLTAGVSSETKKGTPRMHVKEVGGKIKIKCEYIGGATKDNAFIDGTCFRGRIGEKNGATELKGVISTAVIFHTVLALLFIAFIAVCIAKQGFSIVPVCLILFDIFMYKDEFKKQGIIESYIARAIKRLERKQ